MSRKKNQTIKWRAITVMTLVFMFAIVLIGQLYRLQIMNQTYYSDRADRQYLGPRRDIFDRGSIYFTSKNGEQIAAATLKTGYKIAINPSIIENPEAIYNNLSMHIELDEEDFINRISKKDDPYEELARRVDRESADQIQEANLIGVSVFKEKWRFYPGQELASHALGFMSYRGDDLLGQYGLERQYEDVLSRDDEKVFSNFFVEIFSNLKKVVIDGKSPKGSIVTTIEPQAQAFLEDEMNQVAEDWQTKKAGGIIINPQNGEVYALSLNPTFDLNEFSQVDNPEVYTNHLVESVFEMGSIMKPITVAIGLDTGAITPESTYNDTGSRTLDQFTIYTLLMKLVMKLLLIT
jgi:cell division protein FtsI/penicillin-binding protein 2